MKLLKIFISNVLLLFLFVVGVSASGKYITDDAGVLKSNTISTVEQNLNKIEQNTDVVVKFNIIKSLNGKNIDDYANQYAKSNITGSQYILFVVSTGDRKNKLLVGSKVNNVLSQSDISNIVSLPNSDFKNNDFDSGIIKVGKALDEKITTKAVNIGKAEVNSDGYSTTIQHKTNWLKVFGIVLLIVLMLTIIGLLIKRKIHRDYENSKKKFAEDNNLDSYNSSNDTFHSANVGEKSTNSYKNKNINENYDHKYDSSSSDCSSNYETVNRRYNSSGNYTPSHTHTTNTTVINNRSNNDFLEGMIIGEMLTESHEHHHYHEEPTYREPERHHESSNSYSSSDWGNSSSSSSWDNGSSSSSWDSSSSSSDYSSSSWDSGSDYSSSDW